jgi:hypothetical protein
MGTKNAPQEEVRHFYFFKNIFNDLSIYDTVAFFNTFFSRNLVLRARQG